MVISARVHYACLAMLELAIRSDDSSPVAIREITDRHGVPGPFLVQILRTLRTAGWVQSIRGSHGGYRLSVDPAKITLLDIAEAVGCQDAGCRTESKATPADEMLQEILGRSFRSIPPRAEPSAAERSGRAMSTRRRDHVLYLTAQCSTWRPGAYLAAQFRSGGGSRHGPWLLSFLVGASPLIGTFDRDLGLGDLAADSIGQRRSLRLDVRSAPRSLPARRRQSVSALAGSS